MHCSTQPCKTISSMKRLGSPASLVTRPLPDFISQLWRKISSSWLRDKASHQLCSWWRSDENTAWKKVSVQIYVCEIELNVCSKQTTLSKCTLQFRGYTCTMVNVSPPSPGSYLYQSYTEKLCTQGLHILMVTFMKNVPIHGKKKKVEKCQTIA